MNKHTNLKLQNKFLWITIGILVVLLCGLVIVLSIKPYSAKEVVFVSPTPSVQPSPTTQPTASESGKVNGVSTIYNQTNYERVKRGIRPLVYNANLANTATLKACDIAKRHYWSHTTPEGVTFAQFMLNNGDTMFSNLGENLAENISINGVVSRWMASPGHRFNILARPYTDIGIGVCGNIIVQHFGER